jgi:hypothetical protein
MLQDLIGHAHNILLMDPLLSKIRTSVYWVRHGYAAFKLKYGYSSKKKYGF